MWRRGEVSAKRKSWGEAAELDVVLDDGSSVRALAYVPQVGEVAVGDRVLLSAAAYERGLGTGGYMMIVAVPDRLPADPPPSPGHIVKARYTPMQFMVQGVDEQESEWHELLSEADSINGMPVVVADLHSALPAIVCGIRLNFPHARIAYVMTDGGALPAWFSQTAHTLKEQGSILGTVTCGQAYGGDLESVNVHTALLAVRLVWEADIAIVAQGPGNLGTGTRWGFSGTAVGEAINAAATLNGKPIACLRMSNGDARGRHYGISHHTLRVLKDVVKVPCAVPVPDFADELSEALPTEFHETLLRQLDGFTGLQNLDFASVATAGLPDALRQSPVAMRTMGRGLDDDSSSFVAAGAAGIYAGQLALDSQ